MKIVIVGVSGFLGSQLAAGLRAGGHTLVGIDVREPSDLIMASLSEFHLFDLTSGDCFPESVLQADTMVLLAAILPIGVTSKNCERQNLAICDGFEDLIEKIRPRQVLFMSSSAVYDPRTKKLFDEDDHAQPLGRGYGSSKLESERRLQSKTVELGAKYCVLRPTPIIGPRHGGLFEVLRDLICRGWPVPLPLGRDLVLQVTDVDDLCSIIRWAIERGLEGNWPVGNPEPTTVANYTALIFEFFDGKSRPIMISRKLFQWTMVSLSILRVIRIKIWHVLSITHPHAFGNASEVPFAHLYSKNCSETVVAALGVDGGK